MIALFQNVSDAKEILTIESVSVIGLMIFFMIYLIWQNHLLKNEIKAKDDKITEIVKEHQKDLRDGGKDMVTLVSQYHTFVEQLSRLRHNDNRH